MTRTWLHMMSRGYGKRRLNPLYLHAQFSLRTMFVAVMVISIPLAWAGFQLDWIRQRRAVIHSGAIVCYPWSPLSPYSQNRGKVADAPYGMRIFGEQGQGFIFLLDRDKVSEQHLKKLFPEAEIVDLWQPSLPP